MTEKAAVIREERPDNLAVGARGGAVALILRIISVGLGLVNQIFLARFLGAGGIGEVILVFTIAAFASMITVFGLQGAMVRFVPEYMEKGQRAELKGLIYFTLWFTSLFSVLVTVLVIIFSNFIAVGIFDSEGLKVLLPVAAFVIPLTAVNDLISGIIKGYKDTFKALFPRTVFSPLLRLIIFLLLFIDGVSTFYAVLAFVLGELFALLLSLKYLFQRLPSERPVYVRKEHKDVLKVASVMIVSGFSVVLYTQADLLIVGKFDSSEAVGIYGVVSRLVTFIAFSLGAFSTIIPPILAKVHISNNIDEMRRVVRESTRWILSISMPICLIFVLEGEVFLKYVYGDVFAKGYLALVILSAGQLINAASGLVGWLLQMTGHHKVFMKITIFWGVCNIVLNIILVPRFGIIGAAVSTSICLSMVNIMSVRVIKNKLSVLTLAKGLWFDIVFVAVIALLYFMVRYSGLYLGEHFLLAGALAVYLWKSFASDDIPWRLILAKK